MPANPTTRLAAQLTRLALDVDHVALRLAAEEHLDVETLLPGAMHLLATALDELETALYLAEKLDQSHRAQDLAAARATAYPARPPAA
jgi:hypothetical protein